MSNNPNSLRALRGDGRKITVPAKLVAAVERIFDSEPRIAALAVTSRTALSEALTWLIDGNHLTTKEYQLIGNEIAALKAADATLEIPNPGVVRTIADRSGESRAKLYELLGLNKYPTEEDPRLDILV